MLAAARGDFRLRAAEVQQTDQCLKLAERDESCPSGGLSERLSKPTGEDGVLV